MSCEEQTHVFKFPVRAEGSREEVEEEKYAGGLTPLGNHGRIILTVTYSTCLVFDWFSFDVCGFLCDFDVLHEFGSLFFKID